MVDTVIGPLLIGDLELLTKVRKISASFSVNFWKIQRNIKISESSSDLLLKIEEYLLSCYHNQLSSD